MQQESSSMLVSAMRNLAWEIPTLLDSFYVFLWDVLTTVVIPVVFMVATAIVTWKVLREIWRILFPPPAAVFHK